MRLVFLPANSAWVFMFGDSLTRLHGEPLFFRSRAAAVAAATCLGLRVNADNSLEVPVCQ